jgi:hypothetical protein
MSVLLSMMIFTVVLAVGFGLNAWTLSAIILGMTVGLGLLMTMVDIQGVKDSWKDRRCELDILLTAFLYKGSDDTRSSSEFMNENFEFCVKKTIREFVQTLITPLLALLGKEIDAASVLTEVMNGLRDMKSNMMESFKKLFEPIYQRFMNTGIAFSQNFQRFLSAMKRVGGIAVSTLYMGMSLQISIQNFVAFVIKVVLIIMGIIAGLFVLLFFGLIPFLFILITTVSVLAEGGVDTGGLGSVFCFDPDTSVRLQNGTQKPIDKIVFGDVLEDGGIVEGVLRTVANKEQMYSVKGIHVSGSHLIWSEGNNDWIPVSELPFAVKTTRRPGHLVCLRTSNRNIVLRDWQNTAHIFRDWEELPLNVPEADSIWNYLVTKILKQKPESQVPKEDPLCGPRCRAQLSTGETIPIGTVKIGDTIYSDKGFTKVVGIYEGRGVLSSPFALSDGVWIEKGFGEWGHPSSKEGEVQRGFHLVTQSGTFWLDSENHSGFIRDFTEVGLENLPLTYSFTHALLKKSLSREELCVLDSLSPASLSCLQPIY